MSEYLSPGVYVEEIETGGKPIEGVSTSTAGFLGECERGPTTPRLISSWLEYQRVYGSFIGSDKYLPYTVQGFFDNGGQRLFIARIVKANAQTAALKLSKNAEEALTVNAVGEGSWGERLAVKITPGTFSGFKMSLFYWKENPGSLFDPDTDFISKPRPALTEIFDNLSAIESSSDYYGKRVNAISNFVLISKDSTDSGAVPEVGHNGTVQDADDGSVTLDNQASATDNAYSGMRIVITRGTGSGQVRTITGYDAGTKTASIDSDWDIVPDSASGYSVYLLKFLSGGIDSLIHQGTAQDGGTNTIKLAGNASDEDDTYIGTNVVIISGTGSGQAGKITDYEGSTRLAAVDANWTVTPDDTSAYNIIDIYPALNQADYDRTDTNEPGKRKGLSGLSEIDEISIVYAPDAQAVNGLVNSLITHCEQLKDRFAVIDCSQGTADVSSLNPRSSCDTKYAAFYYPWIKVVDSQTGLLRLIPPGGHVTGIYARSDTERGVHKAPANETVRGVIDLEFHITKGEQDILNPRGVNCIRAFPGRGIRLWGARTLSSDPLWKYVNIRRLFLFLEESIDEGTQWVVFEPNNEKLWARVKRTITEFLTRVWRDGALMGSKPEDAFFVKVDRTTMTQDDIDNGRLICLIGVAPVKPAEFVIFRIAQYAGGADVS